MAKIIEYIRHGILDFFKSISIMMLYITIGKSSGNFLLDMKI